MARTLQDLPRPWAILVLALVTAVFIASGAVIRGRSFTESALIVIVGASAGLLVAFWQRRRDR